MKSIMKRMLLVPLLAALATAPLKARAEWLGLGWWWVPVVVGGVVVYEMVHNQSADAQQKTVYVLPPPYDYPQQADMHQPENDVQQVPVQAAPMQVVAVQQDWYLCPSSNKYYPYVRSCKVNWEPVPTAPPGMMANTAPSLPPPSGSSAIFAESSGAELQTAQPATPSGRAAPHRAHRSVLRTRYNLLQKCR